MINFKAIQQQTINLIRKQGNKGKVLRTITATGARNSYDENGEEIETLDAGAVQEYEVYYIHKRLKGYELREGSFNDEYVRFTIASQNQIGEDEHRLNVLKGDIFIDCMGIRYSIEQIDHVGQMRNREMLLEVSAKRG